MKGGITSIFHVILCIFAALWPPEMTIDEDDDGDDDDDDDDYGGSAGSDLHELGKGKRLIRRPKLQRAQPRYYAHVQMAFKLNKT